MNKEIEREFLNYLFKNLGYAYYGDDVVRKIRRDCDEFEIDKICDYGIRHRIIDCRDPFVTIYSNYLTIIDLIKYKFNFLADYKEGKFLRDLKKYGIDKVVCDKLYNIFDNNSIIYEDENLKDIIYKCVKLDTEDNSLENGNYILDNFDNLYAEIINKFKNIIK